MGVVAAVALLVAVPISTGAVGGGTLTPATVVTIKAPFKGIPQQGFEWITDSTCGSKATDPNAPSFNMTTGTFHGTANATQVACGSTAALTESGVLGGLESAGNVTFHTTTGKHTVRIFWTVVYTATLHAHGTTTQKATADAEVTLNAEVEDEQNFSSFSPVSPTIYANVTQSGSYSQQVTEKATLVITGTFVAGHTYLITSYISAFAAAETGVGTGSAYATLNVANGGNHATLTSITIA